MKKSHPIKYWFFLFLTAYGILSVSVASIVGIITFDNLREKAANERYRLLEFYLEQTNETLRRAYYSLYNFFNNNDDMLALQLKKNVSENALHKSALQKAVLSLTAARAEITGYFVYVTDDAYGEEFFTFASNGTQRQLNEMSRKPFFDFVKKLTVSPDFKTDRWFSISINGQYYLVCVTHAHNTYLGCYINMNSLTNPLEKIDARPGYSFFTDGDGILLTDSILETERIDLNPDRRVYRTIDFKGEKYTVIDAESPAADIRLVALIANASIIASFSPFFTTLLTILLSGIILLPLALLLAWSAINRPLSGLLSTIGRLRSGDTGARSAEVTRIEEMLTLNQSFNEMMDEINELTASVYEQKLKERQTYLDYLQLQIHPHFFLNCFNLIYSLAELRQHNEVKKLTLRLVKYSRYLFHRSASLVTVKEELDHAENYINIHRIRFFDVVKCVSDVEKGLEDALIPPISIQTYVENSVKHARDNKKQTVISINVSRHDDGRLRVSVRDNGQGFHPNALLFLNSGIRPEGNETHRIGVTNVNERIALLFGEAAFTRYYNNHGSVSEFTIPLKFCDSSKGDPTAE